MVDRSRRGKWAFWTVAALLAAIAALPSAVLVRELQRYRRFLSGFSPETIRQTHPSATPREGGPVAGRLHFAAFRLTAPRAKEVEVVGDFNRWRRGTLPLEKSGSQWEVLLPLPAGRYKYQFIVDGKPQGEPSVKVVP